jgi:hypothetical protein
LADVPLERLFVLAFLVQQLGQRRHVIQMIRDEERSRTVPEGESGRPVQVRLIWNDPLSSPDLSMEAWR